MHITNQNRKDYFSGLSVEQNQVVLLDPDNGFEPEKSFSENHVLYSDIAILLDQISKESVISVFQHFRRKPFKKDFVRIKQRLLGYYTTAIYKPSLMFVAISRSQKTIKKVLATNARYSKMYPVEVIK